MSNNFNIEINDLEKIKKDGKLRITQYMIDKNFLIEIRFDTLFSIIKHICIREINSYRNDFNVYFHYDLYRKVMHEEKLLIFLFTRTSGMHELFYQTLELEDSTTEDYIFHKKNLLRLKDNINLYCQYNDKMYMIYFNKLGFNSDLQFNNANLTIFQFTDKEGKLGFDSLKIISNFKSYSQMYNL